MRRSAEKVRGDAYTAVRHVYDKSPGRSWRRLNGALHDTLAAAIIAHLSFLPDDFAAIRNDMNGAYWMGDGAGSALGDGYYSLAVGCAHTPACISFERYAGRPAALWSEDNKTPQRLHVGSEFTWKAQKLTVTSINLNYLVACSYRGVSYGERDALHIGQFERLGDRNYRQIKDIKRELLGGDSVTIRFGSPVENPYSRKVERVVKITFDEMAAKRKEYEANRRLALKDIAGADTAGALEAVARRLSSIGLDGYRHFDIEDFRAAISQREKALRGSSHRRRVMIWISKSPNQRDMPGADQTLPTARFRFDSGNYCDVTVGKKNILDIRECRIAVEFAWHDAPSAQEDAEAQAEIRRMGLNGPEFLVSTSDAETSRRNTDRWLNQGDKPEPLQ